MRARLVLAAIVVGALVVAWLIRWGCDDAYISYVYARNLVYGDGLTWFGDALEGYTNFLWVLWVAAGFAVGIDPLVWSWVGSLAAMAVVLVVTYRWMSLRTASVVTALTAAGLLAINYTFLAFGTSGLETMLQCALLTSALFLVERMRRAQATTVRQLVQLSLLAAFALWTRLDSAVYLLVLGVVTLHLLVRTRAPRLHYVAAIAPALVLVGGWLVWKLAYYGDILPNTFHAKVDVSGDTLWAATKFVGAFLHSYMLWPVLVAVAVMAIARRSFTARLPAAIVGAWCAYVIFVGGDFMEFRFFVPILPALFGVIAETLIEGKLIIVRTSVLVAALVPVSIHHAKTFKDSHDGFYDSVQQLASFYGLISDNNWGKLGTPLGDVLVDSGAILACNGAGAIPYFADLPTVDQLGLNDRWVARHGATPTWTFTRPGHQRYATHEYLAERKVTFVIGTPRLIPIGVLTRAVTPSIVGWIQMLLGPSPIKSDSVVVVAAPVSDRYAILLWYLTPSPIVDERIRAAGWERREIFRAPR